ncbi:MULTISPECIES: ABC transporter ATP-binding protein [Burkholderia]|jgi:ABC-type branched-subunit amino acid transport system ATPase component|uniref:ATP-binding cassette domain-containing protein n=1 Tax=Burkholderia cenocepacia TaxID=95486 RepID=A0A9Q5WHF3_9BURK|nr:MULTISPECIES: ATP-binding cassette domain-containing protein [Burkholderia]ALV58646.1 branched-chain amino acid ABC transporter substrate-binding protein [Burkholderia cenocepacia]AMU09050.1 branched-chain amino acid ABC transporter substrate-binding protein [Burkholderia cenocepacia]AMU12195.1 branched-chain amino acid ABC transporter substrate-binding protein [Burkholderia cenocepacia]AQQ22304.1 branched-chain amino acid ABC transporter substrate-binding protein [Burkholderia cenocepacia]
MNAPIIKGVGLYRAFGGINAIAGVDVEIGARDLLCVIGPNGAGKSTLVGLMSGAIVPGAGELYLAGERMTGRPMYQYCRRGVVRKFQGTNVFQMMSVRENLEVAALGVSNRQAFSMRHLDGVLEQIGLAAQADMLAMHLPHGERQWLEIGMAMMCRPALLLLDEPAAGLSATDAQRLVHLIHRLREQCAVLAIEHDLRFVQSLNCETWVMHRGQIVRQGRYDDIAKDEEVRRIYLGQGASHAAH